MCQTTAFSVRSLGIGVRTTNHPFCAWLRPSKSISGPFSDSIATRVSGSSGASTMLRPVAQGQRLRRSVGLPAHGAARMTWEYAEALVEQVRLAEVRARQELEVEACPARQGLGQRAVEVTATRRPSASAETSMRYDRWESG